MATTYASKPLFIGRGCCSVNLADLVLLLHEEVVALEKEKQQKTEEKQTTPKD